MRRENQEVWKLVDQFDSTYWSGNDAFYYIDNIQLDDVIQMSYQVSEKVQPYYGYASYTADRIYHGNRLITGELSINFKRDGYLYSILRMVRDGDSRSVSRPKTQNQTSKAPTMGKNDVPGADQDTAAQIIRNLDNPQVARDYVAKFKRQSLNENSVSPGISSTQIRGDRSIFETTRQAFDLTILFGADLAQGQLLRIDNTGNYIRDGVTFQERSSMFDLDSPPQNTLPGGGLRLIGVEIMGAARAQNDDGRPIPETYQFIAKDVRILSREGLTG